MKSEKLLVISSYPPKGGTHHKKIVGSASYAKNTVSSLPENVIITVLGEDLADSRQAYKEGKNVFVKRVWKRGHLYSYISLFKEILKHKNTENILFEFELAMFGGMFSLIPLPFFLFALRLMGKKVTFVFHQVIIDIKEMHGHLNVSENGFYTDALNLLLYLFYLLTYKSASRIIVFDEIFKKGLTRFGNPEKIIVIPHGVEEFNKVPTKAMARGKLGIRKNDFMLLCFGFLAWYKGTDWMVNAFKAIEKENKTKRKITLVVAGGPNPNHLDKAYYRKYIRNIQNECRKNNIILTGFVPEKKIPLYFQAADLVVVPYRTLMSASGPLSIAISFKKPFLVSRTLSNIFETEDMQEVLKHAKINKEDLVFDLNGEIVKKIKALIRSKTLTKKASNLSLLLKKERAWKNIGKDYYEELFIST